MADIEDRLIRIETKIDRVVEHIGSLDVTSAAQHVSLDEHIRRTEILEVKVAPIKKVFDSIIVIGKFLLFVAAIGAGIEGVISLLTYMSK